MTRMHDLASWRRGSLILVLTLAACEGGGRAKPRGSDQEAGSTGSAGMSGGGGSPAMGGRGGSTGAGGGGGMGSGGMGSGGMGTAGMSGSAGAAGSQDAGAPRSDAGMTPAGGKVNWTMQKFDPGRTGWNPNEKVLNPTNVADVAKFGKLFSRPVEGQIYAQPLVVTDLNVGGKVRDVVFIVTMQNWAYAFDANDAKETNALWKANFGMAPTNAQIMSQYPDIVPVIGATATPVIDVATKTMYFTTKVIENGAINYKLHALDLITGMEKNGGPTILTATVPGTGGGSMGGMLAFNPRLHHNRPGLLLQKGTVYIGFASHGDTGQYHGWVFGVDAATMKIKGTFVTNPNKGQGAGIWQSGNGLVGDGNNIYFATGNGIMGGTDPMANPPQLGEAMVKLDNDLKLVDWQVRGTYAQLDGADADFGISGPLLIPEVDELISGGKDVWALVYDKNNLGKFVANQDMVVQRFKGTGMSFNGMHSGGFIYWKGPNGPTVYGWPGSSRLLGFKLGADKKFVETPAVIGPDQATAQQGQGTMVISSDGAQNGIIWATLPASGINQLTKPGTLRAYNAVDGKLLWHSNMMKDRDDVGYHASQSYPTPVNGKVYCPSWTGSMVVADRATTSMGTLHVYGLLP
jgi:hypothetical protein